MTAANNLVDLYLRLSVDRDGKDSLERQESDLRQWAERSGMTVRKVWRDAGKSGYKKDVVRAEFDGAVKALASGEVGTLAVWKLDRLSRRGAGQVGLVLDQIEDAGGRIFFLQDNLDSRTHRMVIMVVSEQARAESANTVLRVKNKIAADAAKGIPKRGTRAFGWELDGITLRESEAVHVREAVRTYLAGERSLMQIAKAWNEAGIRTDGMSRERLGRDGVKRPARGYWTATTVRQLLLRERNAGILIHHGAEARESQIQPIISRPELEQLKSRVAAGTPVSNRARSPLGGALKCECGAPMHYTVSYSQRKGGPRREYYIYKCSQTLYDKSRRHASIQAHIAEESVALQIIASIALGQVEEDEAPELGERLSEIADRLTTLTAQEIRAEDALVEGVGDAKRMKARLEAIRAERAELREEQARRQADRAGADLFRIIREVKDALEDVIQIPGPLFPDEEEAITRAVEAWNTLPGEDQQALVRGRFNAVVAVGGRGLDRVQVTPR